MVLIIFIVREGIRTECEKRTVRNDQELPLRGMTKQKSVQIYQLLHFEFHFIDINQKYWVKALLGAIQKSDDL